MHHIPILTIINPMKLLFSALIVLFSISAWSQKTPATAEEKTNRYLMRWTKELSLTDEQQAKARPVILKMFTGIEQLRNDTTIKNKKMQIKKLRDEAVTGFKAVLSADQVALFDKRMQEMKDKKKAKSDGRKDGKEKKGMKKAAEETIENDDVF